MKFVFAALFLCSFIFSIQAQECYLTLTSGGGVTGGATAYKIYPDGRVQKGNGLGEITYSQSGKMKKSTVKKYFKQTRALLKTNPEFNHPGNLYSSILLHEDGRESKITWGDASHTAPDELKKLHEKMTASLGKLTFDPDLRK